METKKPIKIVFLVSYSVLLLTLLVFISYYRTIPDIIPIHKNFAGETDHYGSKDLFFITLLINAFILACLGYLINKPQILNYPVTVTNENRNSLYKKMQTFLAWGAVMVSVVFAAITLHFTSLVSKSNWPIILALYGMTIFLPIITTKLLTRKA